MPVREAPQPAVTGLLSHLPWTQGFVALGLQSLSTADWGLCSPEVSQGKPLGAIWPQASHLATFPDHLGASLCAGP